MTTPASPLVVACAAPVAVSFTGRVEHQCPFVDEHDTGTATIAWSTRRGWTLELHSLAAWLHSFRDTEISHENLAGHLHRTLDGLPMIADVTVTTTWDTAGGRVVVRAVPGERVVGSGA